MMKLSNDIIRLFKLFNNSGYQLYIIGGAVRDYLLNREICDYDFATNATPNEMMKLLKDYNLDTYQSDLGSIKVHLNNQIYEITTFRKEYGVKDYRYPEKIEYIQNLKEDVIRRDFTINSLAYSLNDGVVDHLNGLSDLKLKLIKFNKDIKVSILEDPIRIIRALRFSLLLNFNILDADLSVMILHADRINNLV